MRYVQPLHLPLPAIAWRLLAALLLAVAVPAAESVADKARRNGPATQVVGGVPVVIADYPFMAHLVAGPPNQRAACGASIVGDRHVLTAAHCVDGVNPDLIDITVGVTFLSDAESDANDTYAVQTVDRHPRYGESGQAFDVAVLTLDRPIDDGADAEAIQLTEPGERLDGKGRQTAVAGWGYRRFNRPTTAPDQLYAATLKVAGPKSCRKAYRGSGLRVSKATMLCAYAKKRDTCQGDSGGPIFVRTDAGPVQIGITSFGIGCAFKGIPGVYTRLSNPDIAAFIDEAVSGT